MAQAKTPDHLCRQALEAVAQCGGVVTRAADRLGIPRSTMEHRLRAAKLMLMRDGEAPAVQPAPEQQQATDRVYELEAQLKAVRANTLTDEWVKRKIIGLTEDATNVEPPKWVVNTKQSKALPGIPVALWSDWHWGEVVEPTQINGINEFNLEIAHRRAKDLVARTINLLRNHIVNPQYPGLVLNLGGDMLTGDIHEELTATNDAPMMPSLLDLFGVLRWALTTLADEFGHLFIVCVAGNHGRNTKKPRAKDRAFTNFDWLLYQFLHRAFEGDKRMQFFIPDGPDALYSVAGHKYLLTHGDSFRGGDGIIGHYGPVLRGQKRKLSRNANIGLEFDTLLHGHFHTYFPTPNIIGNGSLKGLDEYAYQGNFGYEPPIQALWLTHPDHGITIHMPVYLEQRAGRGAAESAPWVSWHGAAA